MDETTTETQIDRAVLRCTTLFVHVVQLVLAVVILGLDAYGVGYVAYNILIYSLIIVSWTTEGITCGFANSCASQCARFLSARTSL